MGRTPHRAELLKFERSKATTASNCDGTQSNFMSILCHLWRWTKKDCAGCKRVEFVQPRTFFENPFTASRKVVGIFLLTLRRQRRCAGAFETMPQRNIRVVNTGIANSLVAEECAIYVSLRRSGATRES
jgi:hypothetical protein